MRKVPINQQNDMYKKAMKVAKRIAVTMLICIPVLIIFAYLTRNIITNSALQIACFVVIMGTAVAIEEIVVREKEKKKAEQTQFETKKDVFK